MFRASFAVLWMRRSEEDLNPALWTVARLQRVRDCQACAAGQIQKAMLKAEHVLLLEAQRDAFDILESLCDLLMTRMTGTGSNEQTPPSGHQGKSTGAGVSVRAVPPGPLPPSSARAGRAEPSGHVPQRGPRNKPATSAPAAPC